MNRRQARRRLLGTGVRGGAAALLQHDVGAAAPPRDITVSLRAPEPTARLHVEADGTLLRLSTSGTLWRLDTSG
jgi:hypothetical protein